MNNLRRALEENFKQAIKNADQQCSTGVPSTEYVNALFYYLMDECGFDVDGQNLLSINSMRKGEQEDPPDDVA